jgi:hypothetical protein
MIAIRCTPSRGVVGMSNNARVTASLNNSVTAPLNNSPSDRLHEVPPGPDRSPDILIRTMAGHITTWSPGMQLRYGFTREQAHGHVSRHLLGTIFPRDLTEIEAMLRQSDTWRGGTIHRHADGGPITAVNHWHLHRSDDGDSQFVTEVHSDIAQEGEDAGLDVADVLAALTHQLSGTLTAVRACVEEAQHSLQAGWPDLNLVRERMTRASSQIAYGTAGVGLLGNLAKLMRVTG